MTTSTATSVPPELTQPPELEDHRRYARRQCKLQARATILQTWDVAFGPVREFDVVVRNISRTGVCFVYFRQLYPDDLVALDFGDLLRYYRVARCRRLKRDCYEIGLAVCSAPG